MTVSSDYFPSISFASLPSPLTLQALKSLKNAVVGNPRAKSKVISDSDLLNLLVDLSRPSESEAAEARLLRVEATIILGSLAHADQHTTALLHLLSTQLVTNLLLALQQASFAVQTPSSSLSSTSLTPQKELETILKTLANIVKLIGEFCDRGKWGTGIDGPVRRPAGGRETWSSERDAREVVGRKIGELLEPPLLNLLLNLIPSPPPPTSSSPTTPTQPKPNLFSSHPPALLPTVLNLLASLIHTPAHRQAFLATTSSTTIPFSHSTSTPHHSPHPPAPHFASSVSKGKQRETPLSFPSSGTGGNDVLVKIVALLRTGAGDVRVKIGALGLLGVLAKEEWVGRELRGMVELDGTSFFSHLGDLARNRDVGVQVAAVEVLATIYKSTRSLSGSHSDDRIEGWLGMMEDLSRLLGERGEERIRASFIMAYLIADDLPLQTVASESDVIRRVEEILEESSGDGTFRGTEEEMDMDLGEEDLDGKARMREGALLLLSTLTLHLPHLRTHLLTILPNLLPSILLASLSHPTSSGVRAAAAQLTRGLSRSVSVLRSSLVDADGAVKRLVEIVKDGEEREEVKSGVVAALANLVLEFAPMKMTLIDRGVLEVLAEFCRDGTMEDLKLNAVWALKNVAYRSPSNIKARILVAVPYSLLLSLLSSTSPTAVQAQGLALVRNLLADSSEQEVEDFIINGLTKRKLEALLEEKTGLLKGGLGSGEEEVVYQAVYVLACVLSGSEQLRRWVVANESLMSSLKLAITAPSVLIRTAACIACLNMVDDPSPFRRGQAIEQLRVSGMQEAIFLYPTDLLGSDEESSSELWTVRERLVEHLRT